MFEKVVPFLIKKWEMTKLVWNKIQKVRGIVLEIKQSEAFIIGEKIYLRSYKQGDEEMLARIENHPDPRSTLFYALPTSAEKIKETIDQFLTDHQVIILIICRKDNDQPIGKTAFFRIDWVGRMAIFYIGIADKINWSKGYGSQATKLMIEYAFETLNLNRIQLHVAVDNHPAVNIYKNAGFKVEGTLREAMYHNGRYCDFYVMGLLRSDLDK
jgi:RimJ/RimL family protein N-acetyltransferase